MIRNRFTLAMSLLGVLLAGCTVHPYGERAARQTALTAGKQYVHPVESRQLPNLPATATPEELVTYALLNNADLKQKYWQWRSAIEQIPQEGTQKTNLMLTFNSMISNGTTSAAMNTLGIANAPMSSILLPDKLELSAQAALEQARSAGLRFDQARFDLRSKVLSAYADYALTAELIRLEQENNALLKLTSNITHARLATNGATQPDALKAINELDLSTNELQARRAELPSELAKINALLGRAPSAPLNPPQAMPAPASITRSDGEILQLAAARNDTLKALAHEIAGDRTRIARAKAEYLPNFGINVSTDLAGVAQSAMGSVMLPILRYQAIDAGIRQAEANLRAAEAMLRQSRNDLLARVAGDLAMVHDLDREMAFYRETILPRAQQIVSVTQNSYAARQSSFLDLLDSQRSLIALRRMVADLQATRLKERADLEAAVTSNVETPVFPLKPP